MSRTAQSTLLLALAISVLFNVFFAVGYLRATAAVDTTTPAVTPAPLEGSERDPGAREAPRTTRPASPGSSGPDDVPRTDDGPRPMMPPRLEPPLSTEQEALWRELRDEQRADREQAQAEIDVLRGELEAQLDGEAPDPAALGALAEREASIRREVRTADAERMRRFLAALDPDQRRQVFDAMRRDHDRRRGRRGDPRERFDRDGDGELDETEKQAWRDAAMRGLLGWAATRHDDDRDGELDDEEWARMRTALAARLREEATSVADADRPRRRPRLAELLLPRYDADANGALDGTEWNAIRADAVPSERIDPRRRSRGDGRWGRGGPRDRDDVGDDGGRPPVRPFGP